MNRQRRRAAAKAEARGVSRDQAVKEQVLNGPEGPGGGPFQISPEELFTKIGSQAVQLDITEDRLRQAQQVIGLQQKKIQELEAELAAWFKGTGDNADEPGKAPTPMVPKGMRDGEAPVPDAD